VRWAVGTVAAQSVPLGAFAQWADRLEGNPLRLVGSVIATIRTGAPTPDAVTALWKDGHLRRLDLQPLSRGEIRRPALRAIFTGHARVWTQPPEPSSRSSSRNSLQRTSSATTDLRTAGLPRDNAGEPIPIARRSVLTRASIRQKE
jgi:hypothetical protein